MATELGLRHPMLSFTSYGPSRIVKGNLVESSSFLLDEPLGVCVCVSTYV